MPRVINAYADNSAIGDSLSKLGDAIYGDQAQKEVYRQKAFGLKRENDNAEPLAAAVRDGNPNNIGYYGVLAGKTGQDAGDFNRLAAANHATNFDDPRLAISMMGAGGSAGNTAIGQGRALANDRSIAGAHDATSRANNADTMANNITTTGMNNNTTLSAEDMRSKRAADTQLAIDGRTSVPVDNGDGTSHYDTKTNAASGNLAVPVTKEGVLGAMLRKYAAGNAPTDVASTAPNAGAPASTGNPFAAIPPQVQHVLGVGMPPQSMVHPQTGQTGVSYDGGQNIVDATGRVVPATGFLPVGQEAALGQARDNNVRASAAAPLSVPNPATSQAAADAAKTSGIGPAIQTDLNHTFGAIPGAPAVIKGAFGSPEIAPDTQRARQSQDVRNNQARAVLLGAPGRQTVQAQKWVNELIPQGDMFSNPATEAAKIPTIVGALQGDYEQLRQVAIDPNTMPADRVKTTQQMRQIESTIRMYTDPGPTPGAQPAAATPQAAAGAPAPQSAAPTHMATGPGGKKLGLVNGQWVPLSGTENASPQSAARPGNDALSQARAAIAAGANPAAVKQRLQQNGIDPSGL
jgi:hypothetical protein